MTDEQLQALFAGMERHLDKRADAIEQRVAASEERIRAEAKETAHALETKLELGERTRRVLDGDGLRRVGSRTEGGHKNENRTARRVDLQVFD